MKNRKQSARHGFTLVELSIALVIIGLLIGGILIGQSMIASGRTRAITNQIAQFDVAIASFYTKYKSFPGDSPFFSTAGNNNGKLENNSTVGATSGTTTWTKFDLEMANFWYHLSQAGFMPDKVVYSNNGGSGYRAGTHVPVVAYGKGNTGAKGGVFLGGTLASGGPANSPWYVLFDMSYTTNSNTSYTGERQNMVLYTATEAMAIDAKLDDGAATTGNTSSPGIVRSFYGPAGSCYDLVTYAYITTDPQKGCILLISIAQNLGDSFR